MDNSEEIQKLSDYFWKKYLDRDYTESVKTLKQLSDLGDVDSTNLLGTMYRFGLDGVAQDTQKAIEYYTKGKDWIQMAIIYYQGAPNVEPNIEKALQYCLQAIEEKDTDDMDLCKSMGLLALIYREKSDFEEGLEWFKMAFEMGDDFSCFGDEEFFDFYLRDAQAGNVRSMLKLGHLEKMKGNSSASAAWYKRALDWDNSENIYDAGTIRQIAGFYRNGDDFIPIAQDGLAAIEWYHRAADFFNDAESKEILYEIYRSFLYDAEIEEENEQ
jgi:TPR repeat protein